MGLRKSALTTLAEALSLVRDKALREFRTSNELNSAAKRAKAFYGVTSDPTEAGFILPDGALLDLSGKGKDIDSFPLTFRHYDMGDPAMLPYEEGRRGLPHASVQDLYGTPTSVSSFLDDAGAIRVDGDFGVSELTRLPTNRQRSIIAELGTDHNQWEAEMTDPMSNESFAHEILNQVTPGQVNRFARENIPLRLLTNEGRDLAQAQRLNNDQQIDYAVDRIPQGAGALDLIR